MITYETIRGSQPTRFKYRQLSQGRPTGVIVHRNGQTLWVTGPVESPQQRFNNWRDASRCASGLARAYSIS